MVSETGEQLGVMPTNQALRLAEDRNLDLVNVAPTAKPPVCKIMDYGKYKFEQSKREKEAKKNQHVVDVKEVQLRLNIDTHDFNTKVNHARRFLTAGNKVKVAIRFRGREMASPDRGIELMGQFAAACEDISVVERPARLDGRTMLMFLAAKTNGK